MTTQDGVFYIIPYQELLGNYDARFSIDPNVCIIPYQELLGNYDLSTADTLAGLIIPYQELLGNYDHSAAPVRGCRNYTIPRAIREL